MAATLDVTLSSEVSLRTALTTSEPYCRVRQFGGGEAVPRRPLLWPADIGLAEVREQHDTSARAMVTPNVYAHFIKNVLVGGYGGHLLKDGRYIVSEDSYPGYVPHFIQKDISRSHWLIEPKNEIRIEKPIYVISHFNPIYGHWLLEIFPKLFSILNLVNRGLIAPILVPSGMPEFVKDTIKFLVPQCQIQEYNWMTDNVVVRRAILPAMMQRQYIFNHAFQRAAEAFIKTLPVASTPSAIFISRTGIEGKFRQLENIEDLDASAERLGLTVVRPEELSWLDQVKLFASAKLIVGEFGSGMHNAIFTPRGAKVVCLNMVTDVQSRIANSFGHDVGYLLDPDGELRLFEFNWKDQKTYTADLQNFEAHVAPLIKELKLS